MEVKVREVRTEEGSLIMRAVHGDRLYNRIFVSNSGPVQSIKVMHKLLRQCGFYAVYMDGPYMVWKPVKDTKKGEWA